MNDISGKKGIIIASIDAFDPVKTFECGQCFRWNAEGPGQYWGIASGRVANIWTENNFIYIDLKAAEDLDFWRDYFDLDGDYTLPSECAAGDYMKRCVDFGSGIRILKQDAWEALCSFIFLTMQQYPAIKISLRHSAVNSGILFHVAKNLLLVSSSKGTLGSEASRSSSAPLRLPSALYHCRSKTVSGRRTRFIETCLRRLSCGKAGAAGNTRCRGKGRGLRNFVRPSYERGVSGRCLDQTRALSTFPGRFRPQKFGSYAGIAQQYIYYYSRSCKTK